MPILNSRFYARTGEDKPVHSQRGLELRGPFVEVHISPQQVVLQQLADAGEEPITPIEGQALIDTGASKTSGDKGVVDALGLPPIGQGQMGTAGGMVSNVTIHGVQLTFPTMPGSPTVAGAMMACDLSGQPFQVLFCVRKMWLEAVKAKRSMAMCFAIDFAGVTRQYRLSLLSIAEK